MMTWYQKLKFNSNPLDVRPNYNLVGLEREESQLKNHIIKEEICFLNGLTGSGKTSLLMKLQKEMKNHKFIYLDAHDLPSDFQLEEELRKKRSFFDKLRLRNYPAKRPVLIIDEFQATDPNLVLKARAKWENPNEKKIKSIVISQISKHLRNVTASFKERLGSRIVVLGTLDEDEMKQILFNRLQTRKKRVNYAEKFDDDALSFIVKCSGGNPRRLLEYADEIFDFHHRKFGDRNPILTDNYTITYYGAREILGLDKVHVEGFEHLGARREAILKGVQKTRTSALEKRFSKMERRILRFLKNNPKTAEDVAQRFVISKSYASKHLSSLKSKKGILFAGKRDKSNLWQISPDVKRLMVKV